MLSYPKPPMEEMVRFILMTHQVEKLTLSMDDITKALKRSPDPNPYVVGHFDAINYLLSLLGSPDFPAKETSLLTNTYRSNEALSWLQTLHQKITWPLVQAAHLPMWEDELIQVKQYECGVWRNIPTALAFSMAPSPELIPPILFQWLNTIATLHDNVKDALTQPYGISKAKSLEMIKVAAETPLLFANLQPFTYASNRLGRLVENALRLNWFLPFQQVRDHDEFIRQIELFRQREMPGIIAKSKELLKTGK